MLDRGPQTRAEFERVLQQLVGRTIQAVAYFEIPYEDGQPMWNRESDSFDSLDFGLQMNLDDGSTFSVTWGTEFTQYNVSIRQSPLGFVEGESARQWDVQQRWRERRLLDTPVVSARAIWIAADARDRTEYPQDLRLAFASGAVVVISAFESRDGELNMGMMDHIRVFFDEAEAQRMVHRTGGGA